MLGSPAPRSHVWWWCPFLGNCAGSNGSHLNGKYPSSVKTVAYDRGTQGPPIISQGRTSSVTRLCFEAPRGVTLKLLSSPWLRLLSLTLISFVVSLSSESALFMNHWPKNPPTQGTWFWTDSIFYRDITTGLTYNKNCLLYIQYNARCYGCNLIGCLSRHLISVYLKYPEGVQNRMRMSL